MKWVAGALWGLVFVATSVHAEERDVLTRAKLLFRRGVNLFEAGDVEAALEQFSKSRALFPSSKNTLDVAVCLDRLERYDEALDLYEQLTAHPPDPIEPADRTAIEHAVAILKTRVGAVVLTSNEPGSVLLDGRLRGELHRDETTRVFALPGTHVVRVVRDGYLTFERSLEVRVGEDTALVAALSRMREAGQLRVEDPEAALAEVFIDGVEVGKAPWEGTLGPGAHVVWTRKGEVGSAPKTVTVFEGETTLVRAESAPLGAITRIDLEPRTATLAIDGAQVGAGPWEGRLPRGPHKLVAEAGGYRAKTAMFSVDRGALQRIAMKLEIDPDDPRWPTPRAVSKLSVGTFGGYAVPTDGYAGFAGLRGALSFRGFALEAEAGYLSYRTTSGIFGTGGGNSFGPTLGGGARYRFDLGERLGFLFRVSTGAFFYTTPMSEKGATGAFAKAEGAFDVHFGRWSAALTCGALVGAAVTVGLFVVPQLGVEYQF